LPQTGEKEGKGFGRAFDGPKKRAKGDAVGPLLEGAGGEVKKCETGGSAKRPIEGEST